MQIWRRWRSLWSEPGWWWRIQGQKFWWVQRTRAFLDSLNTSSEISTHTEDLIQRSKNVYQTAMMDLTGAPENCWAFHAPEEFDESCRPQSWDNFDAAIQASLSLLLHIEVHRNDREKQATVMSSLWWNCNIILMRHLSVWEDRCKNS